MRGTKGGGDEESPGEVYINGKKGLISRKKVRKRGWNLHRVNIVVIW